MLNAFSLLASIHNSCYNICVRTAFIYLFCVFSKRKFIDLFQGGNDMYTNNTKSNNTQTTFQLRQARGGNMYNHLPEEAEAIVNRIGAPIIGFIDRKVDGKLPKVNCCEVYGAKSHWLFTLAKGAEECREGVPYIFVIENVRFNRDDTPSLMVHPVKELSPELLRNERFGNLLAKSARFPLQWPNDRPRTWNYEPLCKHFNLPVDTAEIDLCKHAVDQALAGKISFEEVVELIHLPVDIAGSYGGAAAVKPGNFRAEDFSSGKNKPKRKRTCKGKKYKEPRQKGASSSGGSEKSSGGKNKSKDNGGKGKKGK